MKTLTEYLYFNTSNRRELINITDTVAELTNKSRIQEGFALVSAMHITAGVFVNDEEPGIKRDIMEMLDKLAPYGVNYNHHRTGEDNGDSHLKSILIGHEIIVPITKGKLDLGTWQQIFYAEFDGQRKKRVIIKIFGE